MSATRVPGRRLGVVMVVALAAACGVLAAAWIRDRLRPRIEPRWEERQFVRLAPGPVGRADAPRETWLVPVNPTCPSCAERLRKVMRGARLERSRPRVVTLLVDSRRATALLAASALPGHEVVWDSAGIWRGRWGRRRYGEVLRFDWDGRWLAGHGPGGAVAADIPPRERR